jgi:hypothetical protein
MGGDDDGLQLFAATTTLCHASMKTSINKEDRCVWQRRHVHGWKFMYVGCMDEHVRF